MHDEEMLLEIYRQIRGLFKDLINTQDNDEIKFLNFEISNKLKFICRLKERILKSSKEGSNN